MQEKAHEPHGETISWEVWQTKFIQELAGASRATAYGHGWETETRCGKDLPVGKKKRNTESQLVPLRATLSTSPVCLAHKLYGDVDFHLQQDLAHWAGTVVVTALVNTTLDWPSHVEMEVVGKKRASSPNTRTSSDSDELWTWTSRQASSLSLETKLQARVLKNAQLWMTIFSFRMHLHVQSHWLSQRRPLGLVLWATSCPEVPLQFFKLCKSIKRMNTHKQLVSVQVKVTMIF